MLLSSSYYTGGSSRSGVKRPHDNSAKFPSDTSRHTSFSKAGYGSKHGPLQSSTKTFKSMMRPGTKTTKTASTKATGTVVVFLHCWVKPDRQNHILWPNSATIVQPIVYNYMKSNVWESGTVTWHKQGYVVSMLTTGNDRYSVFWGVLLLTVFI